MASKLERFLYQEEISKQKLVILIFLIASASPLNSSFYYLLTPYLQDLYFSTSDQLYSIFIPYLLGFSFSQLIYGPLSDRYGRKKVTLYSIATLMIGTLAILISRSAFIFFSSRLLQGVGAGYAIVMARSIQKDTFKGKELFTYGAYISTLIPFIALFSPLIGSILITTFHKHPVTAGTLFLSFYYLLLWGVLFFLLPETRPKFSVKITKNTLNFFLQGINLEILFYLLVGSLLYANEIIIYTTVPLMFKYYQKAGVYSHALFINCITLFFILGAYLSYQLSTKINHDTLIKYGVYYIFILSLISIIINHYVTEINNIYLFILFLSFGMGAIGPSVASAALELFFGPAGFISSLYCSTQFLIGLIYLGILHLTHACNMKVILKIICLNAFIMLAAQLYKNCKMARR